MVLSLRPSLRSAWVCIGVPSLLLMCPRFPQVSQMTLRSSEQGSQISLHLRSCPLSFPGSPSSLALRQLLLPFPRGLPGERSGFWLRSETLRGQRSCSGAAGGRMGRGDGSLEKFRKTEAAVPVSCSVDDVTGPYFVAALPCSGLWESPLSLFLPPGKTPLQSGLRLTVCFAVLGTFF